MAKEVIKESGPRPNVAFVGDKPLREVNAQGLNIVLPEDQSKPFYHEQAQFLIRHYPDIYKPVIDKGV